MDALSNAVTKPGDCSLPVMKMMRSFLVALGLSALATVSPAQGVPDAAAPDTLPRSWIDSETGHRVVQLSVEPGTSSLYFTQYAYTAGGTKLVMTSRRGIELVTLATGEIEHVLSGRVGRVLQTGRKSGKIYYANAGAIYSLDPVTKESRKLASFPSNGMVIDVNSDETLAAGSFTEGENSGRPPARRSEEPPKPGQVQRGGDDYPGKMEMMTRRLAQLRPTTVFTVNLVTGEVKNLFTTTDWVNHFQFSPTDPNLMSFAHEGPWWLVDRVWLVHLDTPNPTPMLVHKRTMKMEIANHEYWSNDGQWLWYDLETPMNEVFWVAGYNVTTGQRVWYHLSLDQWSIHYNTSPDGTLFSGDGGATDDLGPHPKHSKYIFLFHPSLLPDQQPPPKDQGLIRIGTFVTENLVNLSNHSYSLEPNSTFSPDGKWVVFRSNMRGPTQVYAVEVAKAHPVPALPP